MDLETNSLEDYTDESFRYDGFLDNSPVVRYFRNTRTAYRRNREEKKERKNRMTRLEILHSRNRY